MKNNFYNLLFTNLFIALIALLSFNGCSDKGAPSLYQGVPTTPIGATPVISSINPPNSSLAGVSQITITGQNFSTNPMEDLVYFNGNQAVVSSATTTQLVLTAPNVTGDSIAIMVAVLHSELFSNKLYYSLKPGAKDFYPDANNTYIVPYSIVSDNLGNIYTSLTVNNGGAGIKEITPDSIITNYATKGTETFWTNMRFGPNGVLYTARNLFAVFQIPAGGGAPTPFVIFPNSVKISQLEFDPYSNLWAGGNNTSIYRIKQDKSFTAFPFTGNITAMRVYNDGGTNYLYVAVQQDSNVTVQRFPIDANGNLGAVETYYDFSGNYGTGNSITALEFSTDGDMYLGTTLPQAIVVVHKDKTSAPLYPGVLQQTGVVSMVWGTGSYLYYTRAATFNTSTGNVVIPQTIVRLDVQKQGATYYGR
ncbi:MAG: IPT/TIG domain-containing protein [Ignavibacteriaceae bacterium]